MGVTLLYPPLVGVTFTDFHENGFAPAAIAWLAWAVDSRRWDWAAAFVALGLAIKEDEALMFVVLARGIAIWAKRRDDGALFRFASGTAIASVLTLVLYFAVVRPLVGGHDTWFALTYITDPAAHQTGLAAVWGRISFLLEAFVPLCFVPFFGWAGLLVAPGLIEVLSSQWSITYTMGQHYAGVWVGEMLVAYALALAAFGRTRGPVFASRLAIASLVICVLNLGPRVAHALEALPLAGERARPRDRFVHRLAAAGCGAASGTHDEIYSHLGFDPNARLDWVGYLPMYLLVDDTYPSDAWQITGRKTVADYVRRRIYRLMRSEDGVELYERCPVIGKSDAMMRALHRAPPLAANDRSPSAVPLTSTALSRQVSSTSYV